MQKNSQIACAFSGFLSILLFFAMGKVSGLTPPPSPTLSADQVASFYAANATGIQVGTIIQMCGLSLLLVFYVGLSAQIRRIETGVPVWSYVSLAMATLSVATMFVSCFFWAVAAFRPDSSPEIIRLLNDLGAISFVAPAPPAMLQLAAIGCAVLADKSAAPLFPRWFGYFSLVGGLLILPSVFVVMYKTGPFAWDGAWGNFGPMIGFLLWALIAQYFMIRIARRPYP